MLLVVQSLLRLIGVFFIVALIFININEGAEFLSQFNIPIHNNVIRQLVGVDLDPALNPQEQLNDQRPLWGIFDIKSIIFVLFLLIAYILLSFDVSEFSFLTRHLFTSTTAARISLNNLISKMKELSESYYNTGGSGIRGVIGNEKIPPSWDNILEQIEVRIPFEDILLILGNSAALTRKNYDRNIKIIANLSNLCPSFGVMGTVLGLVQVLGNLQDPSNLGPSMALALLTTFYGLFLSVIIFKPLLTHIENMKVIEMNGYQAASFWIKNIAENKPSFFLDQVIEKR